ncbi:hypothetical protein PR003_g16870 [Phytophthora rubi]|uniref:Uncharacterized protein n=1 Tax=Phytophthora rubi TaxID=129364 RepID=A0A6A4EK27_9STRA|nr:hypothetical protein PR002_g16501 [Phytophthora rubi]KAE9011504.1 hypothetical protein PR001_g15889 [Phytophthora rubi]KAE9323852.1 hypothetical protein PR003_g16870 [Phytophthora rubi]
MPRSTKHLAVLTLASSCATQQTDTSRNPGVSRSSSRRLEAICTPIDGVSESLQRGARNRGCYR